MAELYHFVKHYGFGKPCTSGQNGMFISQQQFTREIKCNLSMFVQRKMKQLYKKSMPIYLPLLFTKHCVVILDWMMQPLSYFTKKRSFPEVQTFPLCDPQTFFVTSVSAFFLQAFHGSPVLCLCHCVSCHTGVY